MEVALACLENDTHIKTYALITNDRKVLFEGQINDDTRGSLNDLFKEINYLLVVDKDEFIKANESELKLVLNPGIYIVDILSQFKYVYTASYGRTNEKIQLIDCAKYYGINHWGMDKSPVKLANVMWESMFCLTRDIQSVNKEITNFQNIQEKIQQNKINQESNVNIYTSSGCGCLFNFLFYYFIFRLLLLLLQ